MQANPLRDLLDANAKTPLAPSWADAGIGAGIASILGSLSYLYASYNEDVSKETKTMTPLETALLNLIPLLIDELHQSRSDVAHWKDLHGKQVASCIEHGKSAAHADDEIKELEEQLRLKEVDLVAARMAIDQLQKGPRASRTKREGSVG
jgi:hypothetical protein